MNKNLRVSNEFISKFNPCKERYDNYLMHYRDTDFSIIEFLKLENISYSDKIWVWRKFATPNEAALFGLACADSVLHIFEAARPGDLRPRQALDAARVAIAAPTDENKKLASYAGAYAGYAGYAGYAAAAYAGYAAANAAYATTTTTTTTATTTAAAAAAYAADAAAATTSTAATRKVQQEKNIEMLIKIYEDGAK